jgi:Ca2+-binding RTX toxin-like protein
MANVFRFFNTDTGAHFFTSSENEKNSIISNLKQFKFEVEFESNAVADAPGTTPVYRLYNESTGKHLFTSDKAERESLLSLTNNIGAISSNSWNDEGIAYHAYTSSSAEQSTPLYRFFNTKTDSHFYTNSEVEKNNVLLNPDFNFEGIAYYVGGPAVGSTGSGTTINLTANADTPSAVSPAANTLGTVGVETFSGVFDTTSNATITNADILDGAGGIDTLNIRVAGTAAGGSTIAPVSTNVEIFAITNQATGNPFTLDFLNIQGETEVWDKNSVAGSETRMLNVESTAKAGMENTLGAFAVNFKGDRSQSTTDAFKLDLSGAGTTTSDALFATMTTSQSVDSSFEIANISSTKTMSNVNLSSGMSLKTVNVSGDALLMLGSTDNFAGLSTVDASAMTAGGVVIDARDSTENEFVFKGSSATDKVLLNKSTIDTASLLDGGNGKDTLATTGSFNNLQTAVNKATNFEVLESIAGPSTFDASSFTGINEFLFTGNTGGRATFRGVESNDRIVLSTDVTSSSYAIRVEGKNAGTTATIELRAEIGTDGETVLTGRNSSSSSEYGIELRTNISSLVIDSTGTGTNPNLIEVTKGSDSHNYAIGNESTSIIKITGSHDLTILAKAGVDVSDGQKIAGLSKAANIDASDFSGALRIAGSLSNDVIIGGSGKDIIYGMGGSDTMTGNGDSDQFRLAEFYNKTDIITDFATGTDKVGLNEFNFTNTTQTQAGATLASTDYVENLSTISNISGAEDKKVVELQSSLSETQIGSQTSSSAAEAYVLVHNTTTNKAEIWYDSNWNDTGNRSHILTFDNIVNLSGLTGMSNTDFVEYSF